jgi:predicted dehydrogenase
VVGCGPRGREHARAILSVAGLSLSAMVDVSTAARDAARCELAVPVFGTIREAVAAVSPAVIVLATPVARRADLAHEAIRAGGVRAVVLEKPMATDLAEGLGLVAAARQANVCLLVSHQMRFCPEFLALRDAIAEARLGRLRLLVGSCFGNLWNQGIHLLDMVRWVTGDRRLRWVSARAAEEPQFLQRHASGPVVCDPHHPAPPWMAHELVFNDGLRVFLEAGPLQARSDHFVDDWLQKRLLAVGSEGFAEAQVAGFFRIAGRDSDYRQGCLTEYRNATRAFHEELQALLVGVADVHRNEAQGALESLEWALACLRSAEVGKPIELPLESGNSPTAVPPTLPSIANGIEVSIIVPLPDHRGYALDCVRSWTERQTLAGERYEVIFVGDGTEPALERRVAQALRPHDRFVCHPSHVEVELYNAGARQARGRWLLLSEAHCEADPYCLEELLAYVDRHAVDGACVRSVGGIRNRFAKLEERLFEEGFREWSRPSDWRKVILRGILLRRADFLQRGGFEVRFSRFAEWLLASDLHRTGIRLGFASGAIVKHHYTEAFAELYPPIREFTLGECAYLDEAHGPESEFYFGRPAEWSLRPRCEQSEARIALGEAIAVLLGIHRWARSRSGLRLGWAMAAEALARLPVALLGPAWTLHRAELALACARLRTWFSRSEASAYEAYVGMWNAMVHRVRIEYYATHPRPARPGPLDTDRLHLADCDETLIAGFHAPETWQGTGFRWASPFATMLLPLKPGHYQLDLHVLPIREPEALMNLWLLFNGRRTLPRDRQLVGNTLSVRVRVAADRASVPSRLTLCCPPWNHPALAGRETRVLGLPLATLWVRQVGRT